MNKFDIPIPFSVETEVESINSLELIEFLREDVMVNDVINIVNYKTPKNSAIYLKVYVHNMSLNTMGSAVIVKHKHYDNIYTAYIKYYDSFSSDSLDESQRNEIVNKAIELALAQYIDNN